MMKSAGLLAVLLSLGSLAVAQGDKPKKDKKYDYYTLNLKNRANDHFMFQVGYDSWANAPDSLQITGFGRHLNMYVMLDMPFKTNPRWSVGIGVGIGSSNIFFKNTDIRLVNSFDQQAIRFRNVADTNHFKKYKLTNAWAEAPIELRWVANPGNTNKSFKAALGVKVGTMLSGYTKGKNLETRNGQTIYGNKYIVKEKEKGYFQSTRLSGTARVGYGFLSVHAAYQITQLFKEAQGPDVRPWSLGLTISGL